jgi:1-acyl-sn-glycerol-3-phosphate acyltransferase
MLPYSQAQVKRFLGLIFNRLRYEVEGIDHLPPSGPGVIIMNHTGWEEILLTILTVPRTLKIVGMRELMYLDEARSMARVFDTGYAKDFSIARRQLAVVFGKLLGKPIRHQLREFGYIPTRVFTDVWRPTLGCNGMRESVRALETGNLLLFFPEGGYKRDGVMRPFKHGLGLILRILERRGIRVPVIPAAQHSACSITKILTNRFIPRLVFDAPMVFSFDGISPRAFDEYVVNELQARVNNLLPRVCAHRICGEG